MTGAEERHAGGDGKTGRIKANLDARIRNLCDI